MSPIPAVSVEQRHLKPTAPRRLLSGAAALEPSPIDKNSPASSSNNNPRAFQQFSRLTVTMDDMMEAQKLTCSNPLLQRFDIVAVTPGNFKILQYCCRTAEIDLICLDFTHRIPFSLDKKLVSAV